MKYIVAALCLVAAFAYIDAEICVGDNTDPCKLEDCAKGWHLRCLSNTCTCAIRCRNWHGLCSGLPTNCSKEAAEHGCDHCLEHNRVWHCIDSRCHCTHKQG